MEIFDFNVHLPRRSIFDDGKLMYDEIEYGIDELYDSYGHYREELKRSVNCVNAMILNDQIIFRDYFSDFLKLVRKDFSGFCFTTIIDFRKDDFRDSVDLAIKQGASGIKFHSYIQRISRDDFKQVAIAANYVAKLGLFLCIDTSYGTSGMYEYDNLMLASALCEDIDDVPIILLHSGGARVIEAMLLAEDKENIYLETSFSLPYFSGSSIEQDFAFAYKKIGSNRILYGSDYPYVAAQDSILNINQFFRKYNFADIDIEKIMVGNAFTLINSRGRGNL